MSDNTNSTAAGTTASDGTRKRALNMAMFRDKKAIAAVTASDDGNFKISLGRIIGNAFGYKVTDGTLPNGQPKKSIAIMGEFEGVVEATGEVMQAGTVYLPDYFASEMGVALDKATGGIMFAVEILMEKNPRSKDGEGVAYQYTVRNLIPGEAHDPLNQLKARLAKIGQLGKLPAPVGLALEAPAQSAAAASGDGKGKAKAA